MVVAQVPESLAVVPAVATDIAGTSIVEDIAAALETVVDIIAPSKAVDIHAGTDHNLARYIFLHVYHILLRV